MMKRKLLCLALALTFCLGLLPAGAGAAKTEPKTVRLGVLSDVHYFDYEKLGPQVSASTKDFVYAGDMEMRLMAETEGILDAALAGLQTYNPDVVLVCGDLTSNGELINAQGVASKLKGAEDALGAPVYVVNGNHDINNSYAVSFHNDTGTAKAADRILPGNFREVFADLGYGSDGKTVFYSTSNGIPGCLSYATQITDGVTLIVLDDNIYFTDTSARFDAAQQTGGMVPPELLAWAVAQARTARDRGDLVLAMSHHSMVPHYDQVDKDGKTVVTTYKGGPEKVTTAMNYYDSHRTLDNWQQVAETLADAGVTAVFTGHSHCSDIARYTTEAGNTIYDIQTASLAAYPCAYREVTLTQENGGWKFEINTKFVETANIRTTEKTIDEEGNVTSTSVKGPALNEIIQEYSYEKTGFTADKLGDIVSYFIRSYLYEMKTFNDSEYGAGAEGWLREKLGIEKTKSWESVLSEQYRALQDKTGTVSIDSLGITLNYTLHVEGENIIKIDLAMSYNGQTVNESGELTINLAYLPNAITSSLNALAQQLSGENEWTTNYQTAELQKDLVRIADAFLRKALTTLLGPEGSQPINALDILDTAYQTSAKGNEEETLREKNIDWKQWSGYLTGSKFSNAIIDAIKKVNQEITRGKERPLYKVLNQQITAGKNVFSFEPNGETGAPVLQFLYAVFLDGTVTTTDALEKFNTVVNMVITESTVSPLGTLLSSFTDSLTTDHNIPEDLNWTFYAIRLDPQGGTVSASYAATVEDGKLAGLPTPTRRGYTFDGWYTEAVGGAAVTTDTVFDQAGAIYAHWIRTSGSSGGSSVASYDIVTDDAVTGGLVKPDRSHVGVGTKVTVTVTPDQGYKTGTVTAADKNGKAVELTKVDESTYTFIMPNSKVTLSAAFVKDETEPVPTPPAGNERFVDVPKDAWYHDAVYWAVDKGITEGTDETHFSPDASCTRGQMVTFLWRAAGKPAPAAAENPFADVSADAYYYNAVLWAVEKGIAKGTSETTFSPDATVTRAQTVTFLYRYEQSEGGGFTGAWAFPLDYSDAADVPEWACEPFCWMTMHEVVRGSGGKLLPNDKCLRSQIVTMLDRYFEGADA